MIKFVSWVATAEYRMQKAQTDIQKTSTLDVNGSSVAEGDSERSNVHDVIDGVIYKDGTVFCSQRVDDNALTNEYGFAP